MATHSTRSRMLAVVGLLLLAAGSRAEQLQPEEEPALTGAAERVEDGAEVSQDAGASAESAARFVPNAVDTCDGKPQGSACWMELENHPGCFVWNKFLRDSHTITWSGECSGGLPMGSGAGTWAYIRDQEYKEVGEGTYVEGKRTGIWTVRRADGTVEEGAYLDDKRNGKWTFRYKDGNVDEGSYVDGKTSGHWIERLADGGVLEGAYVDGRMNGKWVQNFASGTVMEGPYLNNKRSGAWVIREKNGNVFEGSFWEGKGNGIWVERFRNGDQLEGSYSFGERNGRWKLRRPNADVHELHYVNGRQVRQ